MRYVVLSAGKVTGWTSRPNASSNIPEQATSPRWEAYILGVSLKSRIIDIERVAIERISALVPSIKSIEIVNFMIEIWPALNVLLLDANMTLAKDIGDYAQAKITEMEGATQEVIDAYDPDTDPSWPI